MIQSLHVFLEVCVWVCVCASVRACAHEQPTLRRAYAQTTAVRLFSQMPSAGQPKAAVQKPYARPRARARLRVG